MANRHGMRKIGARFHGFRSRPATAAAVCAAMLLQGCFAPINPGIDREERVMEALARRDESALPPSPLTPADAVLYALCNNLEAKAAELEIAYHNEAAAAARRRLLPNLNLRYNVEHSNHPGARWSESTRTGTQSLESSFSSDPDHRQGEVGLMWNILDFGVGYLKSRQQGEKIRHSAENLRRVRQQVALEVLTHYWRTSAAMTIAGEAEELREELEDAARAIGDSVDMRILSAAEGARRELVVHAGLTELEQWRRAAGQARLDLARALGCGNALDFTLADFPEDIPDLSGVGGDDPSALQTAALMRRPELFQQDSQERVALDEARLALLQMAPNAGLSFGLHNDPDRFLEWNNWMSVGARVSWNLFNIPARVSEKRMADLQKDTAHLKGLAMAAAIMAQVGIAYSDWKVSHEMAASVARRTAARERLVEALAAGESDGQTRPGEVLQERVRLLADRAAALRALAEARVAGARLANAIGLDVDDQGRLLWESGEGRPVDLLAAGAASPRHSRIRHDEAAASLIVPATVPGMRVVMAEDFEAPAECFLGGARDTTPATASRETTRNPAAPPPLPEASGDPATPGDLMAMAPSAYFDEEEAARINRWAGESEIAGELDLAAMSAVAANAAAAEPEAKKTDGNNRLPSAARMRQLYAIEKEGPGRNAGPPARRAPARNMVEIPALSVDDFGSGGKSRLTDSLAREEPGAGGMPAGFAAEGDATEASSWKALDPEEIRDLYSSGLVSSEDALWTEWALRPLERIQASPDPAGETAGSLRPPPSSAKNPAQSVRPDGGVVAGDDAAKKSVMAPPRTPGI